MIDKREFSKKIISSLKRVNVSLDEESLSNMYEFRSILLKWNKTMNLVSFKDEVNLEEKHFIDSIIPAEFLRKKKYSKISDIGSGNGFPGIVIALADKTFNVNLIEHRQKKAAFLREAVRKIGVLNIKVFCTDASLFDYADTDLITCRGFKDAKTVMGLLTKWGVKKDFMIWDKHTGVRVSLYVYNEQCSTWNIEV